MHPIRWYITFVTRFWTSVLNGVCGLTGWSNYRVARVAFLVSLAGSPTWMVGDHGWVLGFDIFSVVVLTPVFLTMVSVFERLNGSGVVHPAVGWFRLWSLMWSFSLFFVPVSIVQHHWVILASQVTLLIQTFGYFAASEVRTPSKSSVVRLVERMRPTRPRLLT